MQLPMARKSHTTKTVSTLQKLRVGRKKDMGSRRTRADTKRMREQWNAYNSLLADAVLEANEKDKTLGDFFLDFREHE